MTRMSDGAHCDATKLSMTRTTDYSSLEPLQGASILRLTDLSAAQIHALIALARAMKADYPAFRDALAQKSLVMLFEKPSLRTRVSFELGFQKLGGGVCFLDHRNELIGQREPVADYGRNLERFADVIVARVFRHETLVALRDNCAVPIINALSDISHPCQALADAMTLVEHGVALNAMHLAWVGDGNNVCLTLTELAAITGGNMTVVTPPSHEPNATLSAEIQAIARSTGSTITVTNDVTAIRGAHAVYTDAWISMGQEQCADKVNALRALQVTPKIMALAGAHAKFMHCLPAHRGEEVVDAVIDSRASIVYDQAENRMHAQNALMLAVLGALPQHRSAHASTLIIETSRAPR